MSEARVAVCVPVYNKELFLAETMQSILDQTFTDFELVVLDNASSDDSVAIATKFSDPRVRVEQNATTVPPTVNFNRVVRLSSAPFVLVVMADDILDPDLLERQVDALESAPDLAMVAVRHHNIDEDGHVVARDRCLRTPDLLGRRTRTELLRRAVRHGGNPIGGPTAVLFRRTAFDAAAGFAEDEPFFSTDISMWLRLTRHGDYLGLPETRCRFRLNSGSYSARMGRDAVRVQRRWVRDLRRTNRPDLRLSDLLYGDARAPLTSVRQQLIFAASAPPSPVQRLAAGVLGLRTPGRA
ncbi:hypothetical protein GCM10009836_46290 [Pseudonocardia ailaonensis]|uniref:Glycosyltransferase 2-like domain-containing protein n=1 Tax=Pseudonocardia ailaonensis TaxID=367279 RepID=A0ABN2NC04_9PSEU